MKRAALLVLAVLASACTEAASSTPTDQSAESSIPASAPSPSSGTFARNVGDTEMVPDPLGDSIPVTTGYLDTSAYGVSWSDKGSKAGRTFSFVFEVAEPIPASFRVPMNLDAAQYSFCLDTDPSSSPGGYPFIGNEPVSCDFILTAVSEGKDWIGTLIDRRPLVHGDNAKTPTAPFFIDDSRMRGWFSVPGALLGNPAEFDWAMSASLLTLPLPSNDFIDLDENYEDMIQFTA
jgi:hypothetical protein